MFTFFLLLLVSGFILASMVYVRMFAIENGRIRVPSTYPSYLVFAEGISKIVVEHIKRISIIFTARALFYFSRVLGWAKGVTQRMVVHMEGMLVRKTGAPRQQGAVSLFLKDVAEHKRMVKIRSRRKAKEIS